MTVYGAFEPGSFNAWTLNQITNVFCTPGVARGGQVTAPGGMNVTLGVDATALDAVIILPNGAYVRTDQAITFVVPSNGGSGTRTDAIVAFVDPTGVASPSVSLTYQTSWAGGFAGNTANQWVVALVSVAVGAVSLSGANITQNPLVANFGNPSFVQAENNAQGLLVSSSAGNNYTYLQTGYNKGVQPTPTPQGMILVTQDSSGTLWPFIFDYYGNFDAPSGLQWGNPVGGTYSRLTWDPVNHVTVMYTPQAGTTPLGQVLVVWNGSQQVNLFGVGTNVGTRSYFGMNGTLTLQGISPNADNLVLLAQASASWFGSFGIKPGGFYMYDAFQNGFVFSGLNSNANVMTYYTNTGTPLAQRLFTGTTTPTNATNGDIWINA